MFKLLYLKLIDLKRDPYGTMDQKKTTIKTNIAKKTPLMAMEDKLRIANKVNKKYQELMNDLEKDYKEACNELGPEEVAELLEKKLTAKTTVVDNRKDGKWQHYKNLEFIHFTNYKLANKQ